MLNPIVVYRVASGDWASYLLYVGQGAYPLAYAGTGLDLFFNAVVVWLGFVLLLQTGASTVRVRHRGAGGTSYRLSSRFNLLTAAVLVLGLLPIALTTGILGGRPPGLDAAQGQSTETDPWCPSADQATYGAYSSDRLVLHSPC